MTTHPRSRWGQNRPLIAPIALSPTLFSWNRATSEVEGAFPVSFAPFVLSLLLVHRSLFKLYLLPSLAEGPGESLSSVPYIYYIIRYIHPSPMIIIPSPLFFLVFLKKTFLFLCRFAEKSYLCTRKTGTPPTSQAGGCFCCATKKEFFDRFS